jgi:hypothetical protein
LGYIYASHEKGQANFDDKSSLPKWGKSQNKAHLASLPADHQRRRLCML